LSLFRLTLYTTFLSSFTCTGSPRFLLSPLPPLCWGLRLNRKVTLLGHEHFPCLPATYLSFSFLTPSPRKLYLPGRRFPSFTSVLNLLVSFLPFFSPSFFCMCRRCFVHSFSPLKQKPDHDCYSPSPPVSCMTSGLDFALNSS